MVVYAFDVDETLEVSRGTVKLVDLVKLREHGHIVGLCGNWAMVTLHHPGWHHFCSFVGPCGIEKHDFLRQLRQYIPAQTTCWSANIFGVPGPATTRARRSAPGWRFIQESDSPTARAEQCPTHSMSGAPGGIRTPDPRLRRPMLYPAELQARQALTIH